MFYWFESFFSSYFPQINVHVSNHTCWCIHFLIRSLSIWKAWPKTMNHIRMAWNKISLNKLCVRQKHLKKKKNVNKSEEMKNRLLMLGNVVSRWRWYKKNYKNTWIFHIVIRSRWTFILRKKWVKLKSFLNLKISLDFTTHSLTSLYLTGW